MTVFRAVKLRTFFFAFHAGAKELTELVGQQRHTGVRYGVSGRMKFGKNCKSNNE